MRAEILGSPEMNHHSNQLNDLKDGELPKIAFEKSIRDYIPMRAIIYDIR